MAFVLINKNTVGASHIPNEIRMGTHLQSNDVSTRSLYIAISYEVIQATGWNVERNLGGSRPGKMGGNSKTDRVFVRLGVNEGTGDDAGFLMLTENKERGYICGHDIRGNIAQTFTTNVSVSKLKHYVLNDITAEIYPEPVTFVVDEKTQSVLVQCPDWLRYNPLSVPQPVVQKPVAKEVVAPVAKPTFRKAEKPRAIASFDELAEKVSANPEVMDMLNRQERRTINKKMQQHLRR